MLAIELSSELYFQLILCDTNCWEEFDFVEFNICDLKGHLFHGWLIRTELNTVSVT